LEEGEGGAAMSKVTPFPKRSGAKTPKGAPRPTETVRVEGAVTVGQYLEGHTQAGLFAIQLMVGPFDTREQANLMADNRITPMMEALLGTKALVTQ